ncbi:MAG TPA: methionine--tRNA ligase subunit beta [Candidatus Omnitrophota bacterium]|nr:methionine--tRNA ligase subunit beta [Candidatus Omnitrophota bacterium]
MITIDDFKKLDLIIAQIKEVQDHPNADKLYVVKIDTGSEIKQLVAGIKKSYSKEELIGKRVVVVNNLEPATIRGEVSNGMLLAATDEKGVVILITEKEVALGSKVK